MWFNLISSLSPQPLSVCLSVCLSLSLSLSLSLFFFSISFSLVFTFQYIRHLRFLYNFLFFSLFLILTLIFSFPSVPLITCHKYFSIYLFCNILSSFLSQFSRLQLKIPVLTSRCVHKNVFSKMVESTFPVQIAKHKLYNYWLKQSNGNVTIH